MAKLKIEEFRGLNKGKIDKMPEERRLLVYQLLDVLEGSDLKTGATTSKPKKELKQPVKKVEKKEEEPKEDIIEIEGLDTDVIDDLFN